MEPRLPELCGALTENHLISINTNLTTPNIYGFSDEVDPDGVNFIHCSLHLDKRIRADSIPGFIDRYTHMRDRGFNLFASQVMYPPDLERFATPLEALNDEGIAVIPKVFRGYRGDLRYPGGYTEEERDTILAYRRSYPTSTEGDPHIDPTEDIRFLKGDLSFKGSNCSAGRDFVHLSREGEARDCHGRESSLGNVFEGTFRPSPKPRPCANLICRCPYYGLRYADGEGKIVTGDGLAERLRATVARIANRGADGLRPLH
jgi:hypothetical protein